MESSARALHGSHRGGAVDGQASGRTIFDTFEDAVARAPGKTAVVAGLMRWTYGELAVKVDLLARHLARLGVVPGDVISVQLPNWAEFTIVYLAAAKVGAVINPLLPIYRAKELCYILKFARTKLVFVPGVFRKFDYRRLYRELRAELPDLQGVVVVGGDCPDDMLDFAALQTPVGDEVAAVAVRGDELAALIFTSGTESSPKGVVHTHDTMNFGNRSVSDRLGLTSEEIIWVVSPVGHATGMMWGVRLAIFLGATMVMQEVWDPADAIELIELERCTFTTAATPFAAMLLEEPDLQERDLSCFHKFMCGGAAIPSTLGSALREKIGVDLFSLWGMSEAFVSTLCGPDDPDEVRFGTDGKALPGIEMAIFDTERVHRLPSGQEGEIATRGPQVCKGYFNNLERTAASFSSDGWLFSGDIGSIDEAGYLRVLGRIKDIINRGGLKISAGEIEDMLLQHPKVDSVAIVGVPDVRLGEKACACIIPRAGETVTLFDLVSLLKERGVAAYKLPEYVALIDALPMTATGKVQKFKLRDDLVSGALPMSVT